MEENAKDFILWKNLKKNFWAFAAIVISIISLVCDRCQDIKIDKQQYELSAINFRPCLVVDTIIFDSTMFKIKSANLYGEENDSTALIEVKGNIITNTRIRLKNTGNTNAKVILAASIDTICGLKKIRDELLSLNYNFFPNNIKIESPFYVDILPNKYYDIVFRNNFSNFKREEIEFHFFILYRNELGQLFDSYSWVKLKYSDLHFDIITNGIENSVMTKNEINHFSLTYRNSANVDFSTDFYSLEENRKISNFINELQRRSIEN